MGEAFIHSEVGGSCIRACTVHQLNSYFIVYWDLLCCTRVTMLCTLMHQLGRWVTLLPSPITVRAVPIYGMSSVPVDVYRSLVWRGSVCADLV